MKQNIFIVGQSATGSSFFGRETLLNTLDGIICTGRGARCVVGPTRIGKTSLIEQAFEHRKGFPDRLFVKISLGDCKDAFAFWARFARAIKRKLIDAALWDDTFSSCFDEIHSIPDGEWFTDLQEALHDILYTVKQRGYRLVFAIDEFDACERLFGQESYYYQTLRTLVDDPDYAACGVLISRRRLELFEAKCPYISTFHGVFPEMPVLPFSKSEMDEFYATVDSYGIKLSAEGKTQLERYTGNMPYLCCLFGSKLVYRDMDGLYRGEVIDQMEIDEIFHELQPQIDRHYHDLIDRLEEDGHLSFVYYLSIDSRCPGITDRDITNMTAMGILAQDIEDGKPKTIAFSRDFMSYLRLKPLKLPAWETMTESEKKLKAIFSKEYPKLSAITREKLEGEDGKLLQNRLKSEYPELHLKKFDTIMRYFNDIKPYKPGATIPDVLTLSKIIGVMLENWDGKFSKYFSGDGAWKGKLEQIKRLRNPMAHAQLESIGEEELAVCMNYCKELIDLKL